MLIYPDHFQNWLDFGWNSNIFSQENALVRVVCEMAAIFKGEMS